MRTILVSARRLDKKKKVCGYVGVLLAAAMVLRYVPPPAAHIMVSAKKKHVGVLLGKRSTRVVTGQARCVVLMAVKCANLRVCIFPGCCCKRAGAWCGGFECLDVTMSKLIV